MMTERKNQQIEMHLITIEDLVPMDHLLLLDLASFKRACNSIREYFLDIWFLLK